MPRSTAAQRQDKPEQRKNVAPVTRRKELDTREHKVGQDRVRKMRSRGPARESLEPTDIEVVERPVSQDKLAQLSFMEEVLTVIVHESTNPADDPIPEVWNGGRVQRFQRGKPQDVKRKFVEVLARAKKTAFSQKKAKDGNGEETILQVPHTALKYPFSVMHDPNPRGRAWLTALLQEG